MSKEEFVARYAARSNVSEEWLLERCEAFPCDCGEDTCQGWQMVNKDQIETLVELGRIPAHTTKDDTG